MPLDQRSRRFWVPRGKDYFLDTNGFLLDPEAELGHFYNRDAISYEKLAEISCLCMLGEPGMGKSTVLEAIHEEKTRTLADNERTLLVNLRDCSTESELQRSLFESPVYSEWLIGSFRLYLFLDSLDECLVRNASRLLMHAFEKGDSARLVLRIACRDFDWQKQSVFEDALRKFWGHERVGVYVLAPLRRADAIAEAAASGVTEDPEAFVQMIEARNAVPFAIKPISLSLLMRIYHRDGSLPPTRLGIYEEGCRCLCEEWSPERRDTGLAGELTPQQRMVIAARVAAVTLFCGRDAIWRVADLGNKPKMDVSVDELVNDDAIRKSVEETVGTALFSARANDRIGWSHQSYCEFLAAWHLRQSGATPEQVLALVTHPAFPGRVPPQLAEVAAWLASMLPQLFGSLARTDPQVLLRSDLSSIGELERAAVVEGLLDASDHDRLLDLDWELRRSYKGLFFARMASILRPYIVDKQRNIVARRVAIDICEANLVTDLQDDLVSVALDTTDHKEARKQATYALTRIGNPQTYDRLKPMVFGEAGDDPQDEMKGCALRALWPDRISADELFPALTSPKDPNLIGAYSTFLRYDLVERLKPEDLPIALDWALPHVTDTDPGSVADLVDKVLAAALGNIETPGVGERLARNLWERIRVTATLSSGAYGRTAFRDAAASDSVRRRVLLGHLLPLFEPVNSRIYSLPSSSMVGPDDIPWLIACLDATDSERVRQVLATLIAYLVQKENIEGFDSVIQASRRHPVLEEKLNWHVRQVGSAEAAEEKRRYDEWHQFERVEEESPLDPPPSARVEDALARFEGGELDAYVHLVQHLCLHPHSTNYNGVSRKVDLPGWAAADEYLKARIIGASKSYLANFDPESERWLGTSLRPWPAIAGYRALQVLASGEPGCLPELPGLVWEKCIPVVMSYDFESGEELSKQMLRLGYDSRPGAVLTAACTLLRANDHFILRRIEGIWDSRIEAMLAEVLLDEAKDDNTFAAVLGPMLEHKSEHGLTIALDCIQAARLDARFRNRAAIAGKALILNWRDGIWAKVWPLIADDRELTLEVVARIGISYRWEAPPISKNLTDDQLSELLVWLSQNGRKEEGDARREQILGWREPILDELTGRGAISAIRRAMPEIEDIPWLGYALIRAEAIAVQMTWKPLTIPEFRKLMEDREGRLVRSGEELLDVLIESLRRLQSRLQGENGVAFALWDGSRPKREERLSDFVKDHLYLDLRSRGLVVNREVEIRARPRGGIGERTDIRVDAVTAGDMISVIVEVKGGWNPALHRDMGKQLVGRYLASGCQHGLYLVGWYLCPAWDDGDDKKSDHPEAIDELRLQLLSQATELSTGNTVVRAFVLDASIHI